MKIELSGWEFVVKTAWNWILKCNKQRANHSESRRSRNSLAWCLESTSSKWHGVTNDRASDLARSAASSSYGRVSRLEFNVQSTTSFVLDTKVTPSILTVAFRLTNIKKFLDCYGCFSQWLQLIYYPKNSFYVMKVIDWVSMDA